jgi:hypothetical protein
MNFLRALLAYYWSQAGGFDFVPKNDKNISAKNPV